MISEKRQLDYHAARQCLLHVVKPIGEEKCPLEESTGRVLAQDLLAVENVPSFDRSPYDGYAVLSKDTENASAECPVKLRVLESLRAGVMSQHEVTAGTASRIMTGAAIPRGADAVIMFEESAGTGETVLIFRPLTPGENVVHTGEDVKEGALLAQRGKVIDAGLMGTMAAQGIDNPLVYVRPIVGIISTGNEIVEVDEPLQEGHIRNANRNTIAGALRRDGCVPRYLGRVPDDSQAIAALIKQGLASCDLVLLTGGVSVGDYDLVPEAMHKADCEILFRGVEIKPGMACCYAVKESKLVCGLSGNPASALTNYLVVLRPALRKLLGMVPEISEMFPVALASAIPKASPLTRFLRGMLDLSTGTVKIQILPEQGNEVLSSAIGCNVIAEVPAGSGPLQEGTVIKGILI